MPRAKLAPVRFLSRASSRLCRLAGVAAGLVGAASLTACVDNNRPIQEAKARKTIPIPVCAEPLAPPRRDPGEGDQEKIRDLDAEQWLDIMVPKYEAAQGMEGTAVDCTGHYVFANEILRYGVPRKDWPQMIDPDDLDQRAGPRGLKAVRLRLLRFENGDWGGPLALVRAVADRAEVLRMGSSRGPEDAKITPVRMGNESLVVAESRRCPDVYNCRKIADFYLLRNGRLINAATVDLERVLRVPSVSERGLYAEYKLETDISYTPRGIQLLEQVKVRIIPYPNEPDRDSDRLLRTVEFSRLLKVERDTLFSTNESVWERVVGQD